MFEKLHVKFVAKWQKNILTQINSNLDFIEKSMEKQFIFEFEWIFIIKSSIETKHIN